MSGNLGSSIYGDTMTPVSRLVDMKVVSERGENWGKVCDVVIRFDGGHDYPIVLGIVVASGEELKFASIDRVTLPILDEEAILVKVEQLGNWNHRTGELCLINDVVSRQILDVDGVEVFRAKELFLAPVFGSLRLVAVSGKKKSHYVFEGGNTLFKGKIVDWATVQPFGDNDSEFRLKLPHAGLRKLRPRELARVLEELDSAARIELINQIDLEIVADAMEEMDADEVGGFLGDTEPKRAAQILANMEPDEAVDALRDLGRSDADEVLSYMPEEISEQLKRLLEYPEAMVGGFMTTRLVTANLTETVEEVRSRLRGYRNHATEIDAVAVIDQDGRLIADLSIFTIAIANNSDPIASLISQLPPAHLEPETFVSDAVNALRDSRHSSVVVVDGNRVPIGRVLADDLVDALVKSSGFHFRLPWVR